jgi:hypothetical protein
VVAFECGDDAGVGGVEHTTEIGPGLGIGGEVANSHVLKATDVMTYVKYVMYV